MRAGQLLLCLHVIVVPAAAERLPLQVFTQADGLAGDEVTDLHQDRAGFLWVATSSGLSRFDGSRFVTYDTRHGLPHPVVHRIVETPGGSLWVSTPAGLARFDPRAESDAELFTAWSTGPDADNSVHRLDEDAPGQLWIPEGSRLLRVVEEEGGVHFESLHFRVEVPRPVESVHWVIEGREDDLWIATSAGLVRVLTDGRQVLYPASLLRVELDTEGTVWAARGSLGAYAFRPEPASAAPAIDWAARFAAAEQAPDPDCRVRAVGDVCFYTSPDPLPSPHVLGLLAEGRGVWLAGGEGLMRFDGEEFRPVGWGQASLQGWLTALLRDADGSLWIGTRSQGVIRLAAAGMVSFGEADGLRGHAVMQLIEAPGGELAVVMQGDDSHWLSVLSRRGFRSFRPQGLPEPWQGWAWNQWIVRDHRGEWWIPAHGAGLFRYPAVERIEQLATASPAAQYTVADGLPSNDIFRAYEARNGDLWLSTSGVGATVVWERTSGRFLTLGPATGLPEVSLAGQPTVFTEDAAGRLWISFYRGGVARSRDSVHRSFEYFGEAAGLPADWVLDLMIDSRGYLWIGTGRAVLRAQSPGAPHPRFERLTAADGLSVEGAWCFAEDRFGRIYVGGTRGVDRFDPETGHWRHLTTADGLASHILRTSHVAENGDLWFGTVGGVSRLTPRQEEPSKSPPIRIGEVRISGASRPVPELGATELSGLTLSPGEDRLTVGYFGIGLKPGEVLRYQHRLRGVDEGWSAPTAEPSVTFAALPAGELTFEVRAVRDDGTVSAAPASLSFTRLPPLWQRGWFLAAVLATVVAAATWLHRQRVERLLALERLRSQIAGDLHDDVGAGLSEIALLSEVARGQEHLAADATLQKVAARARRLREALADAVWAVDPRRDRAGALLDRMRNVAFNLLETAGVDVTFRAAEGERLDHLSLAPDRRRDLLLIFKELVHNIARHAGAAHVEVRFEVDGGELRLTVCDDGCGFDPDGSHQGHGLASLATRATRLGARLQLDSAPGAGCTVRLGVPLRS